MRSTRHRRAWPLLLAVALGTLLLAACGGDDEEPTPQPDAAAPAADSVGDDAPAGLNTLDVGDPAPAFTLPTANGGTVSLADYTGEQPVLLFFHMAAG